MKSMLQMPLLLVTLITAVASVSALAQPALWRVDDQAGRERAYLFGSVHFGTEAMYPLPDRVLEAFSNSDHLAVELDPAVIQGRDIKAIVANYGHYPAGQSLSARLTDQDWRRLMQEAETLGLGESQLDGLKPWLVAVRLTGNQIREQGFNEKWGVDHYFLNLAKAPAAFKPIIQLETIEQQLKVIDSLPEAQQVDFLLQTLSRSESESPLLGDIVQAWSTGDQERLEVLTLDTLREVGDNLQEQLFMRRNRSMAEKIVKSLDQQERLFVVVGAGHIIGQHGLGKLLSDRGFRVSRIE